MTGSTRPDGSIASRAGDPPDVSRRTLLRGAGLAGATGLVGAAASAPAGAQNGFDGWLDDVDNYDGTVTDMTGQSEVTVEVGAEGNGGPFAFAPPAVRVSPGTSIVFEWTSDNHNVLVEEQPEEADWAGEESLENTGYTYSHTFETEGVYKYFCQPHLAVGMKGVVVVEAAQGDGGDGDGGGVPAEYGDWFTDAASGGAVDNYDGTTVDRTGQDEVTVEVGAEGNGGPFAFGPAALRVSPGTTVVFEWTSDNHNVLVEEQPEGADWAGEESLENTGYTYSHTFETEGVYKYFCQPHLALGMKGAIVVGPAPGAAGGDGGGGDVQAPTGPPEGVTVWEVLAVGLGGAALLSPFGVYYYQQRREWPVGGESGRDEHGAIREAPEEDLEEIGHDEYDPWGTLSLIVVYFLILVGLWIFMYFVEFLGNGPTVIG